MLPVADLMQQCAPQVSPVLMQALVRTESAWRPFAIGMDAKHGTVKQPDTLDEAIATAKSLAASGKKFSVGLAQIHISNVNHFGLSWEQAFNPCTNLALGQKLLWSFYNQAAASGYAGTSAVWAALRGYNSGGVHRTVSNDYANRIFAHMTNAQPGLQLPAAATAIRVSTATASPSALQVIPLQAAPAAAAPVPPKQRPANSLDIFERNEEPAGF